MLNYKILGSGDPLIILHGLFGMSDNWQTMARRLSDAFTVILVDLRDHGRSPHTDAFDYQLLADDLASFMEDHFIHRAHIMGHSMGGKTAIKFAVTYEEMVDKLIVVDIAPIKYRPGHKIIFKALKSVPIESVSSRKEVEEVLSKYIPDPSIRLFLMKNLRRVKGDEKNVISGQKYAWKMNLDLLEKAYPNILSEIEITEPVNVESLWIAGKKSPYIGQSAVKVIEEKFPKSKIVFLDSGHWVHAEVPDLLEKEIRQFLSK